MPRRTVGTAKPDGGGGDDGWVGERTMGWWEQGQQKEKENCTTKKICQTGGKYREKTARERCGRLSVVRAERATGS